MARAALITEHPLHIGQPEGAVRYSVAVPVVLVALSAAMAGQAAQQYAPQEYAA